MVVRALKRGAAVATAALLFAGTTGCEGGDTAEAEYPRFSVDGKADGVAQDVRFIQDIGTQATVRGRFQQQHRYRGFTVQAQAGQTLAVSLQAQAERNGFLVDEQVATQVVLYGPAPSESAIFEQVAADSGMQQQASLQHEVQQDGWYLIAATRDEAVQAAQFELDVECKDCQQGPSEPDTLCEPGRLFVEGAKLKSQEWTKCEVVVLEPTELPAEEKLTIGPDVHVRMHYYITDFHPEGWGETELRVHGELEMLSDAKHPIVFESNVKGKQWDGVDIHRAGTQMRHFIFRDSHGGLGLNADSIVVNDAEFELNQVAIDLSGNDTAGIELERLQVHDNEVGIQNWRAFNGRPASSNVSDLFLLDSEFALNGTAINLWQVQGSYIDGLHIHDNDEGIWIRNNGTTTDAPDDFVYISNNIFEDNGFGVNLRGNGVVDSSVFRDNETYAVRTEQGWQKVKNSEFTGNSHGCTEQHDAIRGLRDCGALVAVSTAHTVFRNNRIVDNAWHGVLLIGEAPDRTRRATGRDPAVLNSEISGNAQFNIALVDAPVYSVEFNHIEGGGRGEIGVIYSANSGALCDFRRVQTDPVQWGVTCQMQRNRMQRNNFYPKAELFSFDLRRNVGSGEVASLGFRAGNGARQFEMTQNHVDGVAPEALSELEAQHALLKLTPALDDPEATAGLIRALDLPELDEE